MLRGIKQHAFAYTVARGVDRMVFRRFRKIKRRMFLLLLACTVVWLWWLWYTNNELSGIPVIQPIEGVATESSVCSVTLSLGGTESRAALGLLASVCEGMEIRPCVFVTTDWLKEHPELIPSLSFADLGLLYEESPKRLTRKRTMASMAEENERFLALTGAFPRYVRILDGGTDGYVSAALQSYGQISVGNRSTLSEELSPGSVVDLGMLDGTTGYALAKFCGSTTAAEYSVLPIGELLGVSNT